MNRDDRRLRVFLVDDHDIVRAGARHYIEDQMEVVGEADEVDAAIELIRERQPDIVLLDLRIPGGGGTAVLREVRRSHPDIKFLVLSVSTSKEDVVGVFGAGADGYLTKSVFGPDLPDKIVEAAAGRRPISREVASHVLDFDQTISSKEAAEVEALTPKEREVVNHIARGFTYREVAARLDISPKTVETHMSHIFRKLEIASRNELTSWAYLRGFFRPDDER